MSNGESHGSYMMCFTATMLINFGKDPPPDPAFIDQRSVLRRW